MVYCFMVFFMVFMVRGLVLLVFGALGGGVSFLLLVVSPAIFWVLGGKSCFMAVWIPVISRFLGGLTLHLVVGG